MPADGINRSIKGQDIGTFRWAAIGILHQLSVDGEGLIRRGVGRWIAMSPPDRAPVEHARIVFTGDTGPNGALVGLAKGADLLVSEANSIEQRMQDLIKSGQWQVMTPEEQVRIKGQMAEGHLSTEDVGKMATRAGVKTVVLTHLTWKADDDYSIWADEVKKHFSGPVLIAKDLKEF